MTLDEIVDRIESLMSQSVRITLLAAAHMAIGNTEAVDILRQWHDDTMELVSVYMRLAAYKGGNDNVN
jgi:hypothetical protein